MSCTRACAALLLVLALAVPAAGQSGQQLDDRYIKYDPRIHTPADLVELKIAQADVLIISKSYCQRCMAAKRMAWDELGVKPDVLELDMRKMGDGPAIHRHLKALLRKDSLPELPQVWVGGYYVGTQLEMREMIDDGRLPAIIAQRKEAAAAEAKEEL